MGLRLRRSLVGGCAAAAALSVAVAVGAATAELEPELLAATEVPGDLEVDGTLVGGLSGLAWDPGCDLYYAVSDDRGGIAPYRAYTLRITAGAPPSVEVLGAILLRGEDGEPLPRGELDLEGAALAADGSLYLASEGVALRGAQPAVLRFDLEGTRRGAVPLPGAYLHGEGRGVRDNLGFEGLTLSPGGERLVMALENALLQDGPAADLGTPSPARLLVVDRLSGAPLAEHLYEVGPVPIEPRRPAAARTNGVSEIVALDEHRLLVVERAFAAGVGNRVRLYLVDLQGADDIRDVGSLADPRRRPVRPLAKTLVADLHELGVEPDNIEAAAFGPMLADGRRLLVLIADNNFEPTEQRSQVLLLAVAGAPAPPPSELPTATIAGIQGGGHVSPLVGRCVGGTEGIVTAILGDRSGQAFWLQDPVGDGRPATSEGLLVSAPEGLPAVAVGDLVRVNGRVEERSWGLELPVTRLFASSLEVLAQGRELPAPVRLGGDGVPLPQPAVAAPGLAGFDPARWAADAFESLEGMRVAVAEPVVVGPTTRHGEIAVLGDGGRDAELRTARGGLRLLEHNPNPQRIIIDDALVAKPPQVAVRDGLIGPVEGILHYGFGAYKLLAGSPLRALPGRLERERTGLVGGAGQLTVATVNLENLAAVSADERFSRLGAMLAERLQCPDVLALQEVQDDSGPADDGTVSAAATLDRVAAAAAAAGCGRYDWRVIDPVDGSAGGQPGGNIRNAFLFNPARVEFVDRGGCGAADPIRLGPGGGPGCSPGLVEPLDPAFAARDNGEGGGRRPLVGELRFAGASLVLVNLHLASKGGDDPLFGRRQPPRAGSSARRTRQAELVAGFASELLGADPEARVLVLGDLNDFEGSSALAALEAAGLENLVRRLPLADRYSYVFQGNSQVLDHVLASPALAARAEVDIVHLNAEFPASDRVSDHDPVVVRLSFEP